MKHAARDLRPVPKGAILLFQAEHVAFVVHSRGQPCGVQQHQREQCMRLGIITGRMLRQKCRQPDCFIAQFLANQFIAA